MAKKMMQIMTKFSSHFRGLTNFQKCSIGAIGSASLCGGLYLGTPYLADTFPTAYFNFDMKNIQYISEKNQTYRMRRLAIENIDDVNFLLTHIKNLDEFEALAMSIQFDCHKYKDYPTLASLIENRENLPYALYYHFFTTQKHIQPFKPQTATSCNAALDADPNYLSYIDPSLRTKEMYSKALSATDNYTLSFGLDTRPHTSTDKPTFNLPFYLKQELGIYVHAYQKFNCHPPKVYIFPIDRYNDINSKDYQNLSDNHFKSMQMVEITPDDLYGSITDKNIILSKFKATPKTIKANEKEPSLLSIKACRGHTFIVHSQNSLR